MSKVELTKEQVKTLEWLGEKFYGQTAQEVLNRLIKIAEDEAIKFLPSIDYCERGR